MKSSLSWPRFTLLFLTSHFHPLAQQDSSFEDFTKSYYGAVNRQVRPLFLPHFELYDEKEAVKEETGCRRSLEEKALDF